MCYFFGLCGIAQHGDCALYGVADDVLYLEFVLVVGVPLCEVPELLREVEAVARVLVQDKVLGNLDAVVQHSQLIDSYRCVASLASAASRSTVTAHLTAW